MRSGLVPQLIDEFAGAVGAFSAASGGAYPSSRSSIPELRTAVHTLDGLDTDTIRDAVHASSGSRRTRLSGVGLLLDLALGIGGGLLSDRVRRDNDKYERQLDDACALDEAAEECCAAIDTIEEDSEIGLRELFLAATPIIEVLTMLLRATPHGLLAGEIIRSGAAIIDDTVSAGMETCRDRDAIVDKCLDEWITRCENHCEEEEARPPEPEPDVADCGCPPEGAEPAPEENSGKPEQAAPPSGVPAEPVGSTPASKDPNAGAPSAPGPAPQEVPKDPNGGIKPAPEPAPAPEPEPAPAPVVKEEPCVEKQEPSEHPAPRLTACAVNTVAAQALTDVPGDLTAPLTPETSEAAAPEVMKESVAQVEECYETAVAEVGPEACVGTTGSAGFAMLAIGVAALIESLECCCEPAETVEQVSAPEPPPPPKQDLDEVPEPPPPPKQDLDEVPEPPPPPKQDLDEVPEPPPPPKQDLDEVPEPPPPPKQDLDEVPEPPPPPKQDLDEVLKPQTEAAAADAPEVPDAPDGGGTSDSADTRTRKAGTW